MFMLDYICEQEYNDYQYQQQEQPEDDSGEQASSIEAEIEPIKKITVVDMLYRLYISLSSSTHSERNKLVNTIDSVLKLSDMLSYSTLVTFLDRLINYLSSQTIEQ